MDFIVTPKAKRPISDKDECFYCHESVGQPHKEDCVLISKKVRVKMVVVYEVEVPSSWTKDDIEFHRNLSSWCANNAIEELSKCFVADDKECMCNSAEFEYIEDTSEPYLCQLDNE